MSLNQIDLEQAAALSLPELLERRVEATPDATAMCGVRGELTFLAWRERAHALAAFIEDVMGTLKGERLLLWMGNDDALAFNVALHACFVGRAIAVMLDDRATAREVSQIAAETEPLALLVSGAVADHRAAQLAELNLEDVNLERPDDLHLSRMRDGGATGRPVTVCIEELPPATRASAAEPGDPGIIFSSSGSTGRPKGALWNQNWLVQYAERAVHGIYALPRDGRPLAESDVLQSPIPVYAAAGVMENPYSGVLAGCPVVYETSRFDAAASERRMHDFGSTIYNGAPPHFAMLCDLPPTDPPPRLEMVVAGGSAFTEPLYQRMRARWPKVAIANWYGLMESGCGQTLSFGADMVRSPASIGRPVPTTEMRIVDEESREVPPGSEGELWLRAPGQILGYFRNPEQTARRLHDGWLRTGDRATVDGDGLVHLVGRDEERINRGGFKFYPVEIESVLEEHPMVREAAVVAVPHEVLGQVPVAFVVPTAVAAADSDDLRAHCRRRIAPNKIPQEIVVRDELPRTPYGKVIRRQLVRDYQQLHSHK